MEGLIVTVSYSDDTTETLSDDDYVITGFDSGTPGTNTISINFGGISKPLIWRSFANMYGHKSSIFTGQTDYYIGDTFNAEGLTVLVEYNDGYRVVELTEDKYTLLISGKQASGYVFDKAGTGKVEVISNEEPSVKTEFEVNVSDASIERLRLHVNLRKQFISLATN